MALVRMISGLGDRLVAKLVPATEAHACTPVHYRQFCYCSLGIYYYKKCVSCGSSYGCSTQCYAGSYCV